MNTPESVRELVRQIRAHDFPRGALAGIEFTITDDQAALALHQGFLEGMTRAIGERVLVSKEEIQKTEATLERYHKLTAARITLTYFLTSALIHANQEYPESSEARAEYAQAESRLLAQIAEARQLVEDLTRE